MKEMERMKKNKKQMNSFVCSAEKWKEIIGYLKGKDEDIWASGLGCGKGKSSPPPLR